MNLTHDELTVSCIETGPSATPVNGGVGDFVLLEVNGSKSAAISGEIGPIPAGTYTFSTAIKADGSMGVDHQNNAHTTVMVRDASVPGPPIQ
jgi:hypothetical protein